jgi:hypothetical protein
MAFRPIHIDDLSETVVRVIESDRFSRRTLEPVGPDILTLAEIVAKYRRWLGLPPAKRIVLPLPLMVVVARLADMAGGGPMGSTGLRQALAGNAGREASGVFAGEIGFAPLSMDERLARRPAQTQDLWHARLYFARPLLRVALALMWLGSGVVGAVAPATSYAVVDVRVIALGLPARTLAIGFCIVDVAIGLALLGRFRPRLLAAIQLCVVGGYTIGLTLIAPSLWLDPFGALLKNLPILAAICIWAGLEDER